MKKAYCTSYDDLDCCNSCHREDQFHQTEYRGRILISCCLGMDNLKKKIDGNILSSLVSSANEEFYPENNCE